MSLQTGTLQITGLRLETLEILDVRARVLGKTVQEYARDLIEEEFWAGELLFDERNISVSEPACSETSIGKEVVST